MISPLIFAPSAKISAALELPLIYPVMFGLPRISMFPLIDTYQIHRSFETYISGDHIPAVIIAFSSDAGQLSPFSSLLLCFPLYVPVPEHFYGHIVLKHMIQISSASELISGVSSASSTGFSSAFAHLRDLNESRFFNISSNLSYPLLHLWAALSALFLSFPAYS